MPTTKTATAATPALAALLAQRKQLDEQIRAARQTDRHVPRVVANVLVPRLRRRIAAGAGQDAALDAELTEVRAAPVARLASDA
jgi:hypothetical protein